MRTANARTCAVLNKFTKFCMDGAEKANYNMANKGKVFGLENIMNNSQIIDDEICVLLYQLFILQVKPSAWRSMQS